MHEEMPWEVVEVVQVILRPICWAVYYEKGLAGCVPSTLAAVRLFERKHELLGMNSAVKVPTLRKSVQNWWP